jgi:hypothetical protein
MASRATIGYLKKTIEALRRERALANEGLLGDDDRSGSGDGGGDGYYGGGDAANGVGAAEEAAAMASMEREKATYAACCGCLRDEKAAIEHIQKLMEQARAKLQAEFDEWYGQCLTAEARHAVRGTQPLPTTGTSHAASAAAAAAEPAPASAVGLTGNKAADEDILAFERAKEELYLLQRRQAQQRS